jgi:ADP-ribose pyrophosphatase YjhB (NUDIX family)
VSPERWKGKWCIPGAVLNYGEDPALAAFRVVKDQTGNAAKSIKLLDVQSYGTKHWDLCFLYEVDATGGWKLGQDFDKADYFDPASPPPEIREDHREVIDTARSRKVI